jgi:hypothetical protein
MRLPGLVAQKVGGWVPPMGLKLPNDRKRLHSHTKYSIINTLQTLSPTPSPFRFRDDLFSIPTEVTFPFPCGRVTLHEQT